MFYALDEEDVYQFEKPASVAEIERDRRGWEIMLLGKNSEVLGQLKRINEESDGADVIGKKTESEGKEEKGTENKEDEKKEMAMEGDSGTRKEASTESKAAARRGGATPRRRIGVQGRDNDAPFQDSG